MSILFISGVLFSVIPLKEKISLLPLSIGYYQITEGNNYFLGKWQCLTHVVTPSDVSPVFKRVFKVFKESGYSKT